ncbi:S-layer homology domain-containing protein [Paenibacillus sp. 1781tsa1]|uniref:S-layer homology domain-containing protein n=1 Tax=Paenibacillus sp. 1781tsa1 TaxID=2953810 RepID=UPI00209C9364|nr:S-layer homology domain-containing protein [Paenibacillus sp. 1781tsa1]MCP1186672.1 S-layer homology domain-containing protein [Paenibacillus sp. 1781tsa1]
MSLNWKFNVRIKMFATKVTTAAMATLLLATQTPGFAGSASAAQAEQVNEATTGENEQLDATSNDVPEGAKISSRQASENILRLFPLLKKATISSARFDSPNSYPPPDYKAWEIGFQITQGNHTSGFSGTVHAGTGEVLSVHLPSDILDKHVSGSDVKLTKAEAEEKAVALLYQAIPGLKDTEYAPLGDLYSSIEQESLFGRTEYRYAYQLKHDGLLSDAETVYINVDESGLVTGYSRGTTAAKYPSSKPAASEEKARQQFEEQFDVELAYISKDRSSSKQGQQYYLGYTPKNISIVPIEANTLERINTLTGKAVDEDSLQQDTKLQGDVTPFVPTNGTRLNVQQAANRVVTNFDIPKGYKLEHSQLSKGFFASPNNQVWSLSWSDRSANTSYMFMRDISAQVDAVTGQIYSYTMMQRIGPEQEKQTEEKTGKLITRKQAEKLAMNTVIALVPDATEQFRLANVIEIDDARTFMFQRYLNGIQVKDDTAQVQVLNDGTVNEFYTRIAATPEQLPADDKPAIGYEEAKALYLEEFKLILAYSRYGGYGLNNGQVIPVGVNLAYMPTRDENSIYGTYEVLDANTGEWKLQYGETGAASKTEPTDILGHVAEAALRNMTQHGVLLADEQGRVFPDRVITRGDWFNYLARAINPNMDLYYSGDGDDKLYADVTPDSPYYKAIKVLIDQRWLAGADPEQNLNPQEEMTREELAVLLVRILRYEKLAGFYTLSSDLPNIADASAITSKGAVSLSLKLGLLPSIEGRFMPARKVTVAEASQVLERLAKLQGKTDTFMSGNRLY